jgi:hypothetical protein
MTRQRAAVVLTVIVLAAALGIALARKTPWRGAQPSEPQDTVYAALNAARAGDVKAYLANYSGGLEASLKQSLAESGEAAFASYLVQSNADVKGVAVGEPVRVSDSEVSVWVEYIYQDRNQTQTMYLEKTVGAWKISRTDADERVKTLVPYGTPVK